MKCVYFLATVFVSWSNLKNLANYRIFLKERRFIYPADLSRLDWYGHSIATGGHIVVRNTFEAIVCGGGLIFSRSHVRERFVSVSFLLDYVYGSSKDKLDWRQNGF